MVPTAVLARVTGLLEPTRQDDSGNFCRVSDIFPLRTQEFVRSIKQYDSCVKLNLCRHLFFRHGFVWPR
jgi:hypothetical protein